MGDATGIEISGSQRKGGRTEERTFAACER
jgi:hypothetical protein